MGDMRFEITSSLREDGAQGVDLVRGQIAAGRVVGRTGDTTQRILAGDYGHWIADLIRRALDIFSSLVGLIVLAPLLLVIALAISLDSRGAPFYGSWRLTYGGRAFRCWKYRSMYRDSHSRLSKLVASDPSARDEWDRFHKLTHDPRVTRMGRLLRATSLDELPQLVNVLLGQMSLVGPRPYLMDELAGLPEAEDILSVRPGITGLWQVSGRNELTFRQRLRIERFYTQRRSLGWDVALLARTVNAVVQRRGAR